MSHFAAEFCQMLRESAVIPFSVPKVLTFAAKLLAMQRWAA
jgi:hypothetical protein